MSTQLRCWDPVEITDAMNLGSSNTPQETKPEVPQAIIAQILVPCCLVM